MLQMVEKQRKLMPRIGGKKLLIKIQPYLPKELQIGRDKFFDFLSENGLLIRRKRSHKKTTYSNHWLRKYPNLIKDYKPEKAHELWVSDITYIETMEGPSFLSLITDGYSRKIVGWELGDTLESKYPLKALDMALKQLPENYGALYHHSDRGVQYCCEDYVRLLTKHKIKISMTESGDPRDNSIAERVNGILKHEWPSKFETRSKARAHFERIIGIYNEKRPHLSIDMKTPVDAHVLNCELKRRWKNYYGNKNKDVSFISPNEVMATR